MQSREKLNIWTIGTSKRGEYDFLNLLKRYQTEAIVDVRRFPTSRLKHFKQSNIEAVLNQNGIEYHHVIALGGYRKGGYKKYMATAEFETGLLQLEALAASKRVAILCAERLYTQCHRRFIADALKQRGHTVIHIIDEKRSEVHKGSSRNNLKKY
ncbi:MAG: DUF488 domain-containing protein [Halobacteriota archaeon]